MSPLTPSRRSELRAQAHALAPVVIIGDKGLTDEVMAEIDRSLKAHELIKVRCAGGDRDEREIWMTKICEQLSAHPVQQIGKVLVVYRENFDKPREKRSEVRGTRSEEKPATVKRRPRTSNLEPVSKRTERPRSRTPSPRPESEPRRRRPRTSR